MSNIVTYLKEQQKPFSEVSLNAIDSLVLSTVSYLGLESIDFGSGGAEPISLVRAIKQAGRDQLVRGNWLVDSKETDEFLAALCASNRYADVIVAHCVSEESSSIEKQFSASCLILPHNVAYLAFRGTDGSFAGWKEDFNLSFKSIIPSQAAAARYVSGVASAIACPLILGGHSKGGNIAEYAALVTDESVYKRIVTVYNHDGPSFLENPSPRISTEGYRAKLNKTVPESSAFGMVLENRDTYRVVKSDASFFFQHEPFTWIVDGDDFVYQDGLNEGAVMFDATLDSWLKGLSAEERCTIIEAGYDLLSSTQADNWPDFSDRLVANAGHMLKESAKLDSGTKRLILSSVASFASQMKDEAIRRFLPAPLGVRLLRRNAYVSDTAAEALPLE